MNKVRRGMIAPRRISLLGIDGRCDLVADLDRAFIDRDFMDYQALYRRISVGNSCRSSGSKQFADIANLSA